MISKERESRLERGLALMEGGHWDEAVHYLRKSLEIEGYSELCECALDQTTYLLDSISVERDEIVADDPTEVATLEGIHYLRRGEYGRAITRLRIHHNSNFFINFRGK